MELPQEATDKIGFLAQWGGYIAAAVIGTFSFLFRRNLKAMDDAIAINTKKIETIDKEHVTRAELQHHIDQLNLTISRGFERVHERIDDYMKRHP